MLCAEGISLFLGVMRSIASTKCALVLATNVSAGLLKDDMEEIARRMRAYGGNVICFETGVAPRIATAFLTFSPHITKSFFTFHPLL